MKLIDIIKGSEYELSLFSDSKITKLESRIVERQSKKRIDYYITCLVRKKEIKVTPEEIVRQLYLLVLTEDFGYPVFRMELEFEVTFGREKKRADIVIFDKQQATSPYIIVELKKPKLKDGKEQLKSYCNATGAPIGVWDKFTEIFAEGFITLECSLCPAVSHFLGKLYVMLFKEFELGFLLDTYTEIGILQFDGCYITVRLHQVLIVAAYFHSNFIHCTVDSLRFGTLVRSPVVLYVTQPQGNVHLATELFDFTVYRDMAHQRQVAVGFLAAFFRVEQNFVLLITHSFLGHKTILQ